MNIALTEAGISLPPQGFASRYSSLQKNNTAMKALRVEGAHSIAQADNYHNLELSGVKA
jgi:hypothetical protein